ncbi:DUF882 domain-containing protein [Oricola sp.]|uniref:DUF882 domain-containing protein n=1 Tax=Oricola sp. TaxID=1979950 RepID=UPI003BA85CF4
MFRAELGLREIAMCAALRALIVACLLVPALLLASATAEAETRTLKLYYIHTKERAEITFKRNGRYDQAGLKKLNRFLRDWRRNEPTKMDPKLFDVLWEAYQLVGARDYIHVVSAYRSPATNEMLRRTRGGQAKKSQHTVGKAIDFYIPGVKLAKLREVGFKLQGGGVGYYPKSGSPFVHFDTGNVRAWPRMSRKELSRVFPNGKTLHLPPDGKPLPGYKQALAEYKARKSRGDATADVKGRRFRSTAPATATARSGGTDGKDGNGKSLVAAIFGGGNDNEAQAPARRQPAPAQAARPAAPVVPEPETPGTVIASLSASETPLPVSAPRARPIIPLGDNRPLIADRPVALASANRAVPRPLALVPDNAGATPVALVPSLEKQKRPGRRSASEIEAALNGVPSENALARSTIGTIMTSAKPVAAPRQDRPVLPIPIPAPRRPVPAQPEVQVASLPVPALRDRLSDAVDAPKTAVVPAIRPAQSGTPVTALAPNADARIRAAYDSGVVTTAKTARPEAAPAPIVAPAARLASADEIDPARFGSWTTSSISITDHGRAGERPAFIQNALREAPTAVYADGFQHLPPPDPQRFSGKAVTFLAVARFAGGKGGDGQPLTLQIPANN